MLKKCTFRFLFTLLAMAGMSAAAYNGTPTAKADFATETINNKTCYKIGSAEDLYGFAAIVNGTNGNTAEPTACGVLTADITVNENVLTSAGELNTAPTGGFIEWTPIGYVDENDDGHPFAGTFDGQGHTISGLYFNDHDAGVNVGLFGYVSGDDETVSISNVGVEDSYFNAQSAVGGVVGWVNYVALNMENVYNAAVVVGVYNVGGVVGSVNLEGQTLSMANVYNVGSINGTDATVGSTGGLVGDFMNDLEESKITKITIKNSYNYGNVVGGDPLVGVVEVDYEGNVAVTVTNSFTISESKFEGNGSTAKSADDFSNGTVYAALHSAEDGSVWHWYSGDAYPTFVEKHSVTLHYSATESETIYFAEGAATPLPTADADGNVFIWYAKSDLTGTKYSEIPATATSDLEFYSKKMNLVDGYYEISDADMLFKFAELVNTQNSTFASAKAKLTANITVNENVLGTDNANVNADGSYNNAQAASAFRVWTPIGNSTNKFQGAFHGQGHTISGLYFNDTEAGDVGLFGDVSGTVTIDSVGLVDSYINAGGWVGGLVGFARGSLTISDSYNASSVTSYNTFGGLVGAAGSGSSLAISNSYNVGSLNGGGYGGGLVGYANALVVSNSYNAGPIYNSDELKALVGGITSSVDDASTVTNSFNYGAISYPSNIKVVVDDLVAEGGEGKVTVTNSFSIGESRFEGNGSTKKSEDEFADGTVLAALRNSEDGEVWRQYKNDAYPTFVKKSGTTFVPNEDGYYEIATAEDLYKFAEIVNAGNGDVKAKLIADIVVNEHVLADANGDSNVNSAGAYIGADSASFRKWTPIGSYTSNSQKSFKGTFDGQGHTISGLYLNKEIVSGNEYSALFGTVGGNEVSIKNVGIEDSYFAAQRYVGGIVGLSIAEMLKIENCYNDATLYGINGIAGIVGEINSSERGLLIENSYNSGTIKYYTDASDPLPSGAGALVGKAGNIANVINSYYLVQEGVESDFGTAATSSAFANGTVAALLHGDGTDADSLWGQNVTGGESHPTFFKGINVEEGPGIITGGPDVWEVTLTYPVGEPEKITYVEGWGTSLPATDKEDQMIIWYDANGSFYNEISSTVSGDLDLHAVVFKPGNDGFYEINDVAKLYKFAAIVNGGNGDVNAKLTADIEVNKNVLATAGGVSNVNTTTGAYIGSDSASFRKWTPIGSENNSFQGIFDGEAHKISGLYYNDENAYDVGLFGYVEGNGSTIIKNVGVEDSYFKALDIAGGILGEYGGGDVASIENVYSAATVVAGEGAWAGIGGIVGAAWEGDLTITNAYNDGSVIGGSSMGGIVGYIEECSATIKNSFNYGNVAGDEPLVGSVADADVSVTNSYYLGDAAQGDYGTVKSATEFADGTVYAALHSGENGDVWFLKPGDKFPTLLSDDAGPAVYEVTLNFPKAGSSSEYDSETISYVEGFAKSLPTMDKNGKPILGWYTAGNESTPITEISTSATGAMTLFPKMFVPAADGCYEIADANQLYLFAAVVNAGNFTACGKLAANIVVNENVLATAAGVSNVDATTGAYTGTTTGLREWTPIGTYESPFKGTLDGQGYTVSGLYFNDENAQHVGLIGYSYNKQEMNVSVKNIGVEDSYFRAKAAVGGIVGMVGENIVANVENVYNAAVVVETASTNAMAGGVVGYAYGKALNMTNVYNVGEIFGSVSVGGLVGSINTDVTSTIKNGYSYESGANDLPLVGNGTTLSVTNSFYLGDATQGDYGSYKSATEFADGTVLAALLSGADGYIWKQGEKYPVFGSYEPVNGCYEIANASQLYWFAAIVNNGNTNACGKLVADIEVNENVLATAAGVSNVDAATGDYTGSTTGLREWTPIGNGTNPFTGSFDGQGHTISGLYFNGENVYDVGLFGRVAGDDDGASIANVDVDDSYFGNNGETGDHVGGVVGMVTHGGVVDVKNVSSAAVVVGNEDVGGVVGYVLGTGGALELNITNAYNVGMVKGSDDVGGLVGDVTIDRAEHEIAINNSYNYGDVSFEMNDGGAPLIGTVVNTGSVAKIAVTNSYYLASEEVGNYGTNKSVTEFADGTVLVALRSGEDGYVWVQAPGDKYPTIDINASKNADTIVLAWTTAADSTTLAAAGYTDGAVVVVKDGKKFYADGDVYEGILSAEQVATIGDNKLYPISGVDLETADGKLVAYLDGDSKETVLIPTDVVVDKVIYKRNVPKMTFSTIMLPFSVPVASVSKHSFYKLKRVAEDDPDYHYAVKVSAITKTVAANRPYIMIDSTGSNQIEFEVENEKLTLNTTTGTMEVSTTTTDGITWKTKGVYEYKEWLSGDPELGSVFVFAAKAQEGYRIGQFAKVGAGASIQPMRLFLQVERPTRNAPGRLSGNSFSSIAGMPESISVEIEDDDEIGEEEKPMVVKNITIVPKAPKSSNWFDVNGRALGQKPTAKGTYYHNGQRVIIK